MLPACTCIFCLTCPCILFLLRSLFHCGLQLISQTLLNKLLPFLVPKPAFFQARLAGVVGIGVGHRELAEQPVPASRDGVEPCLKVSQADAGAAAL